MRCSSNKEKGDASEMLVALKLQLSGVSVSSPWGDNDAYDLIADIDGKGLQRIQVKTGHYKSGSLTWSCQSHGSADCHGYVGDADFFGVADLKTLKAYLIPVCSCGKRRATLRIQPLSGKRKLQALGWAKDYEIVAEEKDVNESLEIL